MGRATTDVTRPPPLGMPSSPRPPPAIPLPGPVGLAAGLAAPAAAATPLRLGMMRTAGLAPSAGCWPEGAPEAGPPTGASRGDSSGIDLRLHGVALDELAARLDGVAHEGDEDLVRQDGVVDGDLQQR